MNEERRQQWEGNLKSFNDMPTCCKRKCCSGGIETCFLRELRRKFLEMNSQVERKRFLIDIRDPESPTGFSIVQGSAQDDLQFMLITMPFLTSEFNVCRGGTALLLRPDKCFRGISLPDFFCCSNS